MAGLKFATGSESRYPTIALPEGTTKRVDEMEKTGHSRRWREDVGLVNESRNGRPVPLRRAGLAWDLPEPGA